VKRARDDIESLVYAYGRSTPVAGLEYALAEQQRCLALWNRLVNFDEQHEVA